jgi:putative flippase GtrA
MGSSRRFAIRSREASIQRGLFDSAVRFIIVGALSVGTYVGGVALLHRVLEMGPAVANVIAYLAGTLLNYFLNFYWSFQTNRSHQAAVWRYVLLQGFGVVLNTVYVAAMLALFSIPLELAALSFTVIWPFFSFFALRYWAFR